MDAYYRTNVENANQAAVLERLLHKRIYRAGQLRFDVNDSHMILHATNIKKTETDLIRECMTELGFDCVQLFGR